MPMTRSRKGASSRGRWYHGLRRETFALAAMRALGAGVEPIYFWPQAAWQVLFCARQGWKQTVVVSCMHFALQATSVHLAKQATFLASHCVFLQVSKSMLHLSKQEILAKRHIRPCCQGENRGEDKNAHVAFLRED